MPTASKKPFVVCVCNDGYEASLELRKIYTVVADSGGGSHRLLRVIDESGEDYLYPEHYFMPITLSKSVEKSFAKCTK